MGETDYKGGEEKGKLGVMDIERGLAEGAKRVNMTQEEFEQKVKDA